MSASPGSLEGAASDFLARRPLVAAVLGRARSELDKIDLLVQRVGELETRVAVLEAAKRRSRRV
ncbi:MAG: hypothetical protein L3J97_06545, partial [Thermoplasmata archaeon]|nr:hypothetical protein [Thermoplasmata archaeon]